MPWYYWSDYDKLTSIEQKQDRLLGMMKLVLKQETQMAIDTSAIKAAVETSKGVQASVLALVTQLGGKIADLAAQLAAAIAANDPAAQAAIQADLDALSASLNTESDSYVAAVAANSPPAAKR